MTEEPFYNYNVDPENIDAVAKCEESNGTGSACTYYNGYAQTFQTRERVFSFSDHIYLKYLPAECQMGTLRPVLPHRGGLLPFEIRSWMGENNMLNYLRNIEYNRTTPVELIMRAEFHPHVFIEGCNWMLSSELPSDGCEPVLVSVRDEQALPGAILSLEKVEPRTASNVHMCILINEMNPWRPMERICAVHALIAMRIAHASKVTVPRVVRTGYCSYEDTQCSYLMTCIESDADAEDQFMNLNRVLRRTVQAISCIFELTRIDENADTYNEAQACFNGESFLPGFTSLTVLLRYFIDCALATKDEAACAVANQIESYLKPIWPKSVPISLVHGGLHAAHVRTAVAEKHGRTTGLVISGWQHAVFSDFRLQIDPISRQLGLTEALEKKFWDAVMVATKTTNAGIDDSKFFRMFNTFLDLVRLTMIKTIINSELEASQPMQLAKDISHQNLTHGMVPNVAASQNAQVFVKKSLHCLPLCNVTAVNSDLRNACRAFVTLGLLPPKFEYL